MKTIKLMAGGWLSVIQWATMTHQSTLIFAKLEGKKQDTAVWKFHVKQWLKLHCTAAQQQSGNFILLRKSQHTISQSSHQGNSCLCLKKKSQDHVFWLLTNKIWTNFCKLSTTSSNPNHGVCLQTGSFWILNKAHSRGKWTLLHTVGDCSYLQHVQ